MTGTRRGNAGRMRGVSHCRGSRVGASAAVCHWIAAGHHRSASSFFFQAEDGIRDYKVTGVQTCALPISAWARCWCRSASPASRCRGTVRRPTSSRPAPARCCTPSTRRATPTSSRTARSTPSTSGECEPMTETLTGAQILCRTLLEAGVDVIFGYPGGAIMPFYHALGDHPALRHILVRHEQAAAHAADGYARASGRVGVCVATSGPGATNLVTGLATAHMDSSPVVAITGQVPRGMIGRDAFQETDIVGITLPITKQNYLVQDVAELAGVVREALAVAQEGRPGPVLIDVPKDVQNQKTPFTPLTPRPGGGSLRDKKTQSLREPPSGRGVTSSIEEGVREAARLIAAAERPLLMVGHGVIIGNAYSEVRALAEKTGIPVITTLLGISAFPDGHPLFLGMPGMHGEVRVNRAIQHADLIVGIGLRFDDRVTGNTAGFAPRARIVHIDLDRAEIGKNVPVTLGIVGDARDVTRRLAAVVQPRTCERWLAEIHDFTRPRAAAFRGDLAPETILASLYQATEGRCTIVTDVGQHQMWVAKLYPYREPNSDRKSTRLNSSHLVISYAM